jgi:hypothetical protein
VCYNIKERKHGGQAEGTKEDATMENTMDTLKDFGKKVKEFVEENRQLICIIAGAIAAVTAVCLVVGLLCRKK